MKRRLRRAALLVSLSVTAAVEAVAFHPVAVDRDWTQVRHLAAPIAVLLVPAGYLAFLELRFTYREGRE